MMLIRALHCKLPIFSYYFRHQDSHYERGGQVNKNASDSPLIFSNIRRGLYKVNFQFPTLSNLFTSKNTTLIEINCIQSKNQFQIFSNIKHIETL